VHINVLLPTVTSVLGFAFALVLLRRFVVRHRPYEGVWALGLLWYALAAGSEAIGGALGWSPDLYRLWYATGAIGVAAYLGAGTLYLHRDPPFGSLAVICLLGGSVPALATNHLDIGFLGLGAALVLTAILSFRPGLFAPATLVVLMAASVAASYRIFTAELDITQLPVSTEQIVSGAGFDPNIRALTPPFNIAGALILILGAITSALHFWRTRALPNRVASNVLIAVGASRRRVSYVAATSQRRPAARLRADLRAAGF